MSTISAHPGPADGETSVVVVDVVDDDGSQTEHTVTLRPETLTQLGRTDDTPETFVTRCFEFLLEREPKESILRAFDVEVIGQYFPEFPTVILRS